MTAKEYWEELNKEYGLDLEMPKNMRLDSKDIQFDMAMGKTIDSAIQHDMDRRNKDAK